MLPPPTPSGRWGGGGSGWGKARQEPHPQRDAVMHAYNPPPPPSCLPGHTSVNCARAHACSPPPPRASPFSIVFFVGRECRRCLPPPRLLSISKPPTPPTTMTSRLSGPGVGQWCGGGGQPDHRNDARGPLAVEGGGWRHRRAGRGRYIHGQPPGAGVGVPMENFRERRQRLGRDLREDKRSACFIAQRMGLDGWVGGRAGGAVVEGAPPHHRFFFFLCLGFLSAAKFPRSTPAAGHTAAGPNLLVPPPPPVAACAHRDSRPPRACSTGPWAWRGAQSLSTNPLSSRYKNWTPTEKDKILSCHTRKKDKTC